MSESEREVAKRIFLRLTALGEGVEDSRRRVPVESLLVGSDEETRRVLHTLTAARLVTADTDADGRDVDELAHEALLREWPRLRGWLDDDRDQLRQLAHLEQAARDWETSGRPNGDLYSGRRLEGVEEVTLDRLNELERRYLQASRDHRESLRRAKRRSTRRLQALAVVLVVLLVVSTVAAVVAVRRGNDARTQTRAARLQASHSLARELTAEAKAVATAQPELSVLLAAEAARVDDSVVTRAGLLNAVYAQPHIARISSAYGPDLAGFQLSADGHRAVSWNTGGSLQLWDFAAGKRLGEPFKRGNQRVTDAAWSTRGALAVSYQDGTLLVFSGGEQLGRAVTVKANHELRSLAFTADGSILAGYDGATLFRWATATGRLLGMMPNLSGFGSGQDLVASPAARTFAIATFEGSSNDSRAPSTIRFIDATTGQIAKPAVSIHVPGYILAYSPDGSKLAMTAGVGESVILIDTTTGHRIGALIADVQENENHPVAIAFSPDGKYVAVQDFVGSVYAWRVADQHFLGRFAHPRVARAGLTFLPDSDHFVSANPQEVVTWAVRGNGSFVTSPGFKGPTGVVGNGAAAVDFTSDRLILADEHRLHVFGGNPLQEVAVSEPLDGVVHAIDVSTDGTTAVGLQQAGADRNHADVVLFKTSTSPKPYAHVSLANTAGKAADPILSPSGSKLAVGVVPVFDPNDPETFGGNVHGDLFVFDMLVGGKTIFHRSSDTITAVAWTRDEKRLLLGPNEEHLDERGSIRKIGRRGSAGARRNPAGQSPSRRSHCRQCHRRRCPDR